jgi:hypothetical protein
MADGDGNNTGSNVVWAIALVIIVAIVAFVLMKGGMFWGSGDKKINVDVSAPASAPAR